MPRYAHTYAHTYILRVRTYAHTRMHMYARMYVHCHARCVDRAADLMLLSPDLPRPSARSNSSRRGVLTGVDSLASARVGYCDATDDGVEGDCSQGVKGSFAIGGAISDHSSCIERCVRCERCNFVSVSLGHRDCSWFHSCPVTHEANGGSGYLTLHVDRKRLHRAPGADI